MIKIKKSKMMFNYFLTSWLIICSVLVSGYGFILPNENSDSLFKPINGQFSIPFEDCGSSYNILHLDISNCDSLPCKMALGSTVTVNTIFDDGGRDTKFLKHEVRFILNTITSNATITPDPCDGENEECISNEVIGKMYTAKILVNDFLPLVKGSLMWEVWDKFNVPVMCYIVPIKIVWSDL